MKCLGVTWTEKQQLSKLTVTINTKCCCIDISCTKYLYTAPIFPILIIHNKMVLPKNYFSLQRWEFVLINYHFFWESPIMSRIIGLRPTGSELMNLFLKSWLAADCCLSEGDGLLPTVYVFIFIATLSVIFLLG